MSRRSAARPFAAFAAAGAWMAMVLGGGGCEVAIGDTVPGFRCLTGSASSCPAGQACGPSNHCQPVCTPTECARAGQVCGSQGLCGPDGDSGMLADAVVADTSPTPDTSTMESGSPADTGLTDTAPVEGAGACRWVGCPCSGPASCDSNVCGDKESVSTGLYTAAGNANFCTKPCCTSADCDHGTVCFATAVGGNYCVVPGWIGRTTAEGTGLGGATCATGRDCRSGLCAAGATCADTCCSGQAAPASQCAGGAVCTFAAFPGAGIDVNYSANCASSPGTKGNGSSCSGNGTCESQICAADSMFGSNYCHGACRSEADCGSSYGCNYVLPPSSTGLVAVCTQQGGGTGEGQACDPTMDTCKNGFCDPASKLCTSVCFTDADCAVMTGWRCRPEQVTVSSGGSFSVLACGS